MKTSLKIIAFLFFFIMPFSSQASELPSIIEYVENNDMEDEFHLSSLYNRCAGIIGAYAKYIPSSMKEEKNRLADISGQYFEAAGMLLYEKKMTEPAEILEQVQKAYLYYVDTYYSEIEITQIRTGSIFEGRLNDEFKFCMAIREM